MKNKLTVFIQVAILSFILTACGVGAEGNKNIQTEQTKEVEVTDIK